MAQIGNSQPICGEPAKPEAQSNPKIQIPSSFLIFESIKSIFNITLFWCLGGTRYIQYFKKQRFCKWWVSNLKFQYLLICLLGFPSVFVTICFFNMNLQEDSMEELEPLFDYRRVQPLNFVCLDDGEWYCVFKFWRICCLNSEKQVLEFFFLDGVFFFFCIFALVFLLFLKRVSKIALV